MAFFKFREKNLKIHLTNLEFNDIIINCTTLPVVFVLLHSKTEIVCVVW